MASGPARKIENSIDLSSFHVRRYQLNRSSRVSLITVRIETQVLIAERLLEPVGGLRETRVGARSVSHDHLWYGSPRTIVPAR